MARVSAWLLVTVIAGLAHGPAAALTNRITVFAASSLAQPLNTVIEAYARLSVDHVRGVYGASGLLADQIMADAPADIFIAAHPRWMEALRARNLVQPASIRALAGNRLVLLGAAGVNLPADLRKALLRVQPRRIGIADPERVGSGVYAMQVLTSLGLADTVRKDLLVAANDTASAGMVERGEIPVGFAYQSDAVGVAAVHIVATIPEQLHAPIVYSAALVTAARPGAQAFSIS